MSDPLFACLFVITLSHWPEECGMQPPPPMAFAELQPPPPVAFAERWGRWSCGEQTECRPALQVPSVAHGE